MAIIFRYDDTEPEPPDVRLHHLLDDPLYLLSTRPGQTLSTLRDATWIAGCDRCRIHLLSMCADHGFEPRIGYTSDDMVVMQALVVAGLGVTTSPGLALRAHRVKGIVASERDVSPTPDASPDAESECPIVLPVFEGTSSACLTSC